MILKNQIREHGSSIGDNWYETIRFGNKKRRYQKRSVQCYQGRFLKLYFLDFSFTHIHRLTGTMDDLNCDIFILKKRICALQIEEKTMDEIKSTGDTQKKTSQCYGFLFDVLSEVKTFLGSKEACEIAFHPSQGVSAVCSKTKKTVTTIADCIDQKHLSSGRSVQRT